MGIGLLRAYGRAVFFAFYTAKIVLEIYVKGRLLKNFGIREAMQVRRRWARRLLHTVGVRVKTEGTPPNFPCILVCNHRSYLDPIILLREVDGYPVSKAEVEHWPVLGYGAKLAGILYLRREETGSRIATLKAIAQTVGNGFPVILFPEGTTGAEIGTIEFRRGVFQLAAKMNFPIVPAALHFEDKSDFWVGHESFGTHAGRSFQKKKLKVCLRYGPALSGKNPDDLMAQARQWIDFQLFDMQGLPAPTNSPLSI